mgnify:CR=1 FL=1
MNVSEVIVETNEQTLSQVNIFGRDDNTQCECSQYEDKNSDKCTDKYGFRVGLLTAVLSPVINHVLFAMPSEAVLPIILIKSTLLAGASALAAHRVKSVSLLAILGVVLSYQLIGTAFEWMIEGDFHIAVQDFRIGIPGILIQWFGGYALLKAIAKL